MVGEINSKGIFETRMTSTSYSSEQSLTKNLTTMAFVFTFDPQANGMSAAQYDDVIRKLEAAGAGKPAGRLYHVCYGEPNDLHVTDVWDSMENFEAFGQTLMPILQKEGIDPGKPQVSIVHSVIKG
jgi:hypothetical protein